MKKVKLPNMPETRAQDYEKEVDGKTRYCRVIYKPKETNPDRVTISAQAFEVTADGMFAFGPDGTPSRTHGTEHTIATTGLGDTHTLKPAWVRVQEDANPDLAAQQGVDIVTELPASGEPGNRVYKEPFFYQWANGMVNDVMDSKAETMFKLIENSDQLFDMQL